jgi:hypothetical protein
MAVDPKIIKKVILCLVCLPVVLLLGQSIYQNQNMNALSQGRQLDPVSENQITKNSSSVLTVSQQKNVDATASETTPKLYNSSDNVNELKNHLESTEKELDSANKKLSDEMIKKSEFKKKQVELQRQFTKDPSFKNYMKTYLDTEYADIFKELNLTPEKQDKLKDLIVEFEMAFNEISLDSYSASSDEEKASLKKRAENIYSENQMKLKDLLGNTDYREYHDYAERANVRSNVNNFEETLSQDEKLTKDQEKALVEIMYKEQSKVFSEIGYDPNKTLEFPSDVKAGKVEGRSKNMEKIFSRSIENAKGLLSASQLEQFKKFLTDYREKMDMSYKASGMED